MSRPILVCLLLLAPLLAGCAGEAVLDEEDDAVTTDVSRIQVGKGAIAGLLVDDRFRPLHLVNAPESEFQFTGFVLVQEAGREVRTNENGEFSILNLDPGRYTLRVTVQGHEATPQQIQVVEGQFAEISIIARRTASDNNLILTEEFSGFLPCSISYVALSRNEDCTLDSSGDSFRSNFVRNYTGYGDLTWLVTEFLFNQEPGNGELYDGSVRRTLGHDYATGVISQGNYIKLHLERGAISPDPVPKGTDFHEWHNDSNIQFGFFARGMFAQEIQDAYEPVHDVGSGGPCVPYPLSTGACVNEFPMRRGVGVVLGLQASIVISLFLGEPEVDPQTYCALC